MEKSLAHTRKEGPLDIYHRRNKGLLAIWLAKPGVPVDWSRIKETWDTEDAPLILLKVAQNLDGNRRRTATRRINLELQRLGLPMSGPVTLKVSTKEQAQHLKSQTTRILRDTPFLSSERRDYLRNKTNVRVQATKTVRWMRNGISVAKNADLSGVSSLSDQAKAYYDSAADMIRVPGSSNVPVLPTPESSQRETQSALGLWAKRMFF